MEYVTITTFTGIIFTSQPFSFKSNDDFDLIFDVLTPLSAIFQLYHGEQF